MPDNIHRIPLLFKVLIGGILVVMILFFLQAPLLRYMTYPAPAVKVPSPAPPPYEEVEFSGGSEGTALAWLYRYPDNRAIIPVIVMFHGNGENLETMRQGGLLSSFVEFGVHFLAVEYPGYGNSAAKPSEDVILQTADAALQWAAREFPGQPLIVFGWSLGAAVAIQSVARNASVVDGLIAVSPWSSLPDVATAHYPGFLVRALLKEKYNSVEAAKSINCPVLIIHGERDGIIPAEQGKRVAESFPGEVRWVPVVNAGHNDIFSNEEAWQEIAVFIRSMFGDSKQ